MKNRYFLWSVFLLIAGVLIFSFLSTGCTNNKQHVKEQKKELKYPEWSGLDETIEKWESFINKKNDNSIIKITNFYRLGIEPNDIKWHLKFRFILFNEDEGFKNSYFKEINEIIGSNDCEIYKIYKDNISIKRKISNDAWKFKILKDKDFIKLYIKIFDDKRVGYVYCNYQFDLSPGQIID
ncbi:hypothetical protein KAU33_03005 [Candidatus Dependentiae bacterium]|nr:hypothetical protein [Candidatus Dependentiae bacterium]